MLQCGLDNFKNYLFCAHTGRCRCVQMYNEVSYNTWNTDVFDTVVLKSEWDDAIIGIMILQWLRTCEMQILFFTKCKTKHDRTFLFTLLPWRPIFLYLFIYLESQGQWSCELLGQEMRKFPGSLANRPNTWSQCFCLSCLGFRGPDSVLDMIPVI